MRTIHDLTDPGHSLRFCNAQHGTSDDMRIVASGQDNGPHVKSRGASDASEASNYSNRTSSMSSRSTGVTSCYSEMQSPRTQSSATSRHSRFSVSSQGTGISQATSYTSSTTSSAPIKKYFRRIRHLSGYRSSQSEVSFERPTDCRVCPEPCSSALNVTHKLPCGHLLCKSALRDILITQTNIESGVVPRCCQESVPPELVRHVLCVEEQQALLARISSWEESKSLSTNASTVTRYEAIRALPKADYEALTHITPTLPAIALQRDCLDNLKDRQISQQNHVLAWTFARTTQLASSHSAIREELVQRQEASQTTLLASQAQDMETTENVQVEEEAALRERHKQKKAHLEARATHQTAICDGSYLDGTPNGRGEASATMWAALEKTRRSLAECEGKFAAEVNVLRAQQALRIEKKIARNERESREMDDQSNAERQELDERLREESARLKEQIRQIADLLQWKWALEAETVLAEVPENEVLGLR